MLQLKAQLKFVSKQFFHHIIILKHGEKTVEIVKLLHKEEHNKIGCWSKDMLFRL